MLIHEALLYGDETEYARSVGAFVEAAVVAGEPVLVAVPAARLKLLRAEGGHSTVWFADMEEVGRNPARIIPRIRAFIDEHPRRRVRFVGEPIWAGRTESETVEATRHEALINLAFADAQASILCPYDVRGLAEHVVAEAACTHPIVVTGDRRAPSPSYTDPIVVYTAAEHPLAAPPAGTAVLAVGSDLAAVRASLRHEAIRAGLSAARAADLVVAANEAATNSIVHALPPVELTLWHDSNELVCEVTDAGEIHDPLVGRIRALPDRTGGRGLWLANQLCDLVELRSGPGGTVVRLHMTLN